MNAAQKSALVLVYLPTGQDALSWTADKPYWRDRLAVESKKSGWTYIDLLADMRRLPAEDVERLFFEGGWHYTNAGNQWVASRLQPRIEALPPLQGDAPGSSSP
jgi:hypothetical protein